MEVLAVARDSSESVDYELFLFVIQGERSPLPSEVLLHWEVNQFLRCCIYLLFLLLLFVGFSSG